MFDSNFMVNIVVTVWVVNTGPSGLGITVYPSGKLVLIDTAHSGALEAGGEL